MGIRRQVAVAHVFLVAACAGSGSGGPADLWHDALGRHPREAVLEARAEVWPRHGLEVRRTERATRTVVVESEWLEREPTVSEIGAGVVGSRVRYVLRAALEPGGSSGEGRLDVTFELWHQRRTATFPEWHPAPVPEAAVAEARRIAREVREALERIRSGSAGQSTSSNSAWRRTVWFRTRSVSSTSIR